MGGIDGEVKFVVEKLVSFLDVDGLRVMSNEEKDSVLQKIRAVFGSEKWVKVAGLKGQDGRWIGR